MEKIIVRKKILTPGTVSYSLCEHSHKNLKEMRERGDYDALLKIVFNEENTYEELQDSY